MKITQMELERLVHLTSKVVDYVYTPEYEDYWSQSSYHERDDWNDEWIEVDKLNASNHMFKYRYNLEILINKIKSNDK